MDEFLTRMARASARRADSARSRESEAVLRSRALATPPPAALKLDGGGFDLIAEVKRRSPSAGPLVAGRGGTVAGTLPPRESLVAPLVHACVAAGAAAVSVLTEPEEFHGSLADLEEAARSTPAPVLRKDFLVDPYQVLEARAAGASGVLLILKILNAVRLEEMLDAAAESGLFVLLEAFDEEDLARSRAAVDRAHRRGLRILPGVNCRNLGTLAVDPARFARLRPLLPAGVPAVAESGLRRPEDVGAVAAFGYRLALVGEALMRSPDPAATVAGMIRAGREGVGTCVSG